MRRKLSALIVFLIIALLAPCAQASPQDYDAKDPQSLTADQLYAEAAILMDADSGDIFFAKNEHQRVNPASTTKILTLLLGIESGIPFDQQIAIPQAASSVPKDSTLVPVFPGETMAFGDLLLGFHLASGNDGANAVAVLVSGSVDSFVALMNQRAAEIGCTETHFANPHGYTNENHYTTAYDMALITREAMKNEQFRKIVATTNATITVNERGELKLACKHAIMFSGSSYYYEGCIGIKSGTTSAAGNCYVGAAERNGATLISAVFKCAEDEQRWLDTAHLFDYGWTCYRAFTLDQMYGVAGSRIASFVVSNASEDDPMGGRLELEIAQISNSNYLRMVEKDNDDAITAAVNDFIAHTRVEVVHDLTAPISKGEIIGNFSYYDTSTGSEVTAKLVANRDVAQQTVKATLSDYLPFLKLFENKLFIALLLVLLVLLVLIIMLVASRRAARQRRRRRIYEQRREEYLRRHQSVHRNDGAQTPRRRPPMENRKK